MIFFSVFFYSVIKNSILRKILIASTAIFSLTVAVYYYYNYIVLSREPVLDSVPIAIETILIFIFSFIYFFEQLNDTSQLFIYNKPSFWASFGILLYLSGSFFIYILANQIDFRDFGKYWMVTNVASIIKNIFFGIAIYVSAKQILKKPNKRATVYPPSTIEF